MTIIDTHTHFPGYSFNMQPRTGVELREEFASEGISAAWIMTTDGLLGDCRRHNDLLAEGVRNHLDFFVPFCTVSPHDGVEAATKELVRAVEELGMKGLKFHPWLQAFSLSHPAVVPLLEKAGELGLPVVFHDGTPPYSTPLQIAATAERAPHTTIILGHAGLDDLYRDAILACRRHPNVMLCLCGPSAGLNREIIEQCPVEKLLFGSDAGFAPHVAATAVVKVRSSGVSEADLDHIFRANAERVLPLPAG